MSTAMIHGDNFAKRLLQELNADMQKAAEPAVQAALVAVEKVMRERLAQRLVALVDESYSIERRGTNLVITIRQEPTK